MKQYKRQVMLFLFFLALFVAGNYLIWNGYTEALLSSKYEGGDLARLSYLREFRQPRHDLNTLPRRYVLFDPADRTPIDMITIGDSFSIGGGGGLNTYYQDYIASYNNFRVLALPTYQTSDIVAFAAPLSSLMVLYNSGFLDIYKPRFVLVQSVERYTLDRIAKPFEQIQGHTDDLEKVRAYYSKVKVKVPPPPALPFVNMGNIKFLYYEALYAATGKANRKVRLYRLDRPLFSTGDGRSLLAFPDELANSQRATKEQIVLMNDNLNRVARLLKAKGITLYFMPVVNKYTLYYDYIADKRGLPKSIFFEELAKLPKEYGYIDTKAILAREIANGSIDIYYPDDTHWSWKASQAIFRQVTFRTGGR